MGEEIIRVPVIVADNEEMLSFKFDDDTITLELKGKELCSASWEGNIELEFRRMLNIWGFKK